MRISINRTRIVLTSALIVAFAWGASFIHPAISLAQSSPIQVCTALDLDNVRKNLAGSYIQVCDIDLSGYANWVPIGPIPSKWADTPFAGTYDGNGKKISNLKITGTAGGGYAGLFSASTGVIKNVTLVNVDIKGSYNVGSLVAFLYTNGKVSNASASGKIYGTKNFPGNEIYQGNYGYGGLVGTMGWQGTDNPSVENSSASVNISGDPDVVQAGGLVGKMGNGSILNSFATGDVLFDPAAESIGTVGGLIAQIQPGGTAPVTIRDSYAIGNVSAYEFAGGLVGFISTNNNTLITIDNSHAAGNVTGFAASGGLIGQWDCSKRPDYGADCILTNSYATGDVHAAGGQTIGGLIGFTQGGHTIENTYASGNINGGEFQIGGFIGYANCPTIKSSYATGDVTGQLVNSWRTTGIIGGFIGSGGQCGSSYPDAIIENSYATGDVTFLSGGTAGAARYTGGFIGQFSNCMTTDSCSVGLKNSYSTGKVIAPDGFIGGFVAWRHYADTVGDIVSSYWDTQTSGQTKSAGGTGKTTAQMQTASTYQGWDFANVWNSPSAGVYPTLKSSGSASPTLSLDVNGQSSLEIAAGDSYALNWSSSNVASCSINYTDSSTGQTGFFSVDPNAAGSGTNNMVGSYTMTCVGANGQSVSQAVTVTQTSSPAPMPAASCIFNGQTVASGQSVTAYQAASVPSGSTCISETRACTNGVLSGTYTASSCTVEPAPAAPATSCSFNGQTVASGQSVTAYQAASVPSGSTCISEIRTCQSGTLSGSYANATCSVASDATSYAPDGSSITPASGSSLLTKDGTWRFGTATTTSGNVILRNGAPRGSGDLLVVAQGGSTFAHNLQNYWFKWDSTQLRWVRYPGDPRKSSAITHTLAKTWTGPEVAALQSLLAKLGLFQAEVTGYFGSVTESAVKAFQVQNNLSAVGVVGPRTRALLNWLVGE